MWTGIDTSSFMKKDVVVTIEGATASVYSEIDDIFASCNIPNAHLDIAGQLDMEIGINKYCRFYVYRTIDNEMFYQYDNISNNSYIGTTASKYYRICKIKKMTKTLQMKCEN